MKAIVNFSQEIKEFPAYLSFGIFYWPIGKRIRSEVLGNERAEYGREIIATLSQKLSAEFGMWP